MKLDFHILVVEDERIIAEQLRQFLEELNYKKVSVAYSYDKAMEILKIEDISFALLDINLGRSKKDGIELAFYLQENYNIPFLFVTANADKATVERAKITRPLGYIVKPFTQQSIYSSIEIALANAPILKGNKDDSIIVLDKGKKTVIHVSEISFLKAVGNYIEICLLEKKKYLSRQSLKEIREKLPNTFVQVHRSYIVNIKYITAYTASEIQLSSEKIPLSRSYKDDFLNRVTKP